MPYKRIRVRVIEQKGHCAAGHEVGDEIIFENDEVQGKFCIHAMYSIMPKILAMKYEAKFPWLKDKDRATHACPDAYNPVTFEVIREELVEEE
ncbi:MAG: TIGR04076 family protein [Candidatus Heimdallarchaeota archaeon]|nr:TIGR04076 family protein [Candidatus Heimdallarchaeota archaeon]